MAVAALKEDKNWSNYQKFDIHANQIVEWRTKLLAATGVFMTVPRRKIPAPVKDMQGRVGKLAMENEFLAGALGRFDDASAKKGSMPPKRCLSAARRTCWRSRTRTCNTCAGRLPRPTWR